MLLNTQTFWPRGLYGITKKMPVPIKYLLLTTLSLFLYVFSLCIISKEVAMNICWGEALHWMEISYSKWTHTVILTWSFKVLTVPVLLRPIYVWCRRQIRIPMESFVLHWLLHIIWCVFRVLTCPYRNTTKNQGGSVEQNQRNVTNVITLKPQATTILKKGNICNLTE